jgi:hypothetical protein
MLQPERLLLREALVKAPVVEVLDLSVLAAQGGKERRRKEDGK